MSDRKISVTLDIGADIAKVRAAANELSQILNKSNFNSSFSGKVEGMVSKLNGALSELEVKSSRAMSGLGDTRGVETSINKVNTVIKNITAELNRMGTAGSDSLLKLIDGMDEKWDRAGKAQREYTKALRDTDVEAKRLARDLESAQSKSKEAQRKFNSEDTGIKSIENSIKQLKEKKEALRSSDNLSYDDVTSGLETAKKELTDLETIMSRIAGSKEKFKLFKAGDTSSFNEDQIKELTEYGKLLDETTIKIRNLETQQSDLNAKRRELDAQIRKAESDRNSAQTRQGTAYREYEAQEHAIEELQEKIKNLNANAKDTAAFENYKQKLKDIFGDESLLEAKNVDELNKALENLKKNGVALATDQLQKLLQIANGTSTPLQKMREEAHKAGDSFREMTDRASEIDTLTRRLKYFFSLAGGFNLLRRAVRSAITTTKELDAVMTQTAVVSQYSVSDMWKMLPQYSAEAKKLGVAIKDVYSAQTLYVQQGLDMNSAMKIGTETLKMSRVANIGASEATNSMTAALRGFNMELTEKSAKRVNDVYSKLAQNTASNTQEISTAMTKTAALANSANMSFENTAAFLATIIESTREGAETAGTALKTVIARFTEVKKLYSHGELLGSDEEGQEINVNKISTALRTAGINMNEFFTGAKGLDEIFMELGSKWDSLSTVQQRYIATMAAGSRQQSRFLALMQNYSRTVELTGMAYNSAGSGQEQFDKTLESLEAKINKFKDSWDTFIMGLANSNAIKGFIDVGTGILDVLNKIINAISGEKGIIKSISSMVVGISAFKIGRSIFGRGGLLGNLLGGEGFSAGERFGQTFLGGMAIKAKAAQRGELGRTLGIYTGNALKKNLKFWGKGAVIGDTYFNKEQLQNIKDTAQTYKKEIDDLDKTIAESNERLLQPTVGSRVEPGKVDEQTQKEILKDEQERAEAQQKLEKATEERQKTLEKYNEEQQKNGLTPKQSRAALEDPNQVPEATANYKALANAALLAGGALLMVGAAVESLGGAGEKVGGVLKDLGSSLMTFGMVATALQAIGKAIPALSASLGGPYGLAIAGVVAAVTAALSLYDRFTESVEEKEERITKTIQDNQNELQQLQQEYKEINDSIDSLSNKQEAFDNLTQGTLEWKNAVAELNQEIKTLIENFPEFAEAIEYDENGNLKINVKAAREINEKRKERERTNKLMDIAAKQQQRDMLTTSSSTDPFYYLKPNGGLFFNNEIVSDNGNDHTSIYNEVKRRASLFKDIPINILSDLSTIFLQNSSDYEQAREIAENKYGEYFKKIDNYIGSGIKNALTENNEAYEYSTILDTLYIYWSQRQAKEQSKKEFLGSISNLKFEEIDKNFQGYGQSFKNYLSNYLNDLFFAVYSSYTPPAGYTDHELEEYYKTEYYTDKGYRKINGEWRDINNKEITEIGADTAEYYVKVREAYKAITNFTTKLSEIENSTTKALLSGKGLQQDYISGELTKALISEGIDGKFAEKLNTEFLSKFNKLAQLEQELNIPEKGIDFLATNIDANLAAQIVSTVSKIRLNKGKSAAANAFGSLSWIANRNQLSSEDRIDLIQKIVSEEIGNIDDFVEYAKIKGLDLTPDQIKNIGDFFKHGNNKSYKDWVDSFSDEWEFYKSIKSSSGAFSQEDITKILNARLTGVTKASFGEGGIYTGNVEELAELYRSYLEGELTKTQEALDSGKESVKIFTDKIKEQPKDLKGILDTTWKSFVKGELDAISEKDLSTIFREILFDSDVKLYNPQSGTSVKLSNISDEDLKSYAEWYLSGDYQEWDLEQLKLGQYKEILTDSFNKLPEAIQNKITEIVTDTRKTHTGEFTGELLTALTKGSAAFAEGDYEKFLTGDTLEKINWDNIKSIYDFKAELDRLKISFDDNADGAEELFKALLHLYKTSKIITAEDVAQVAQFGAQLKTKVKTTGNGNYSQEEVDYILAQNRELTGQFVRDIEQGGYTYIGDRNVLEGAVDNSLKRNGFEQLEAQYQLSQGELSAAQDQWLQTLFGHGFNELNQEEKDQIAQWQSQRDVIAYQYNQMQAMAPYLGMNNDQARGAGASSEIQQAITLQDAAKAGFDTNVLIDYAQKIQETTDLTTELAYAIAYDAMLMNKGIDDLKDNFSSLEESLISLQTKEANLWTASDIENVNKIKDIVKELTGVTGDLDSKILLTEETLKLLKRIADGDVKAIDELSKTLAKNLVNNLADTAEEGSKAQKILKLLGKNLENFDDSTAKVGDNLDSGIESAIDGLLQMGAISKETAAQLFELMGYEPPEFEDQEINYDANLPELEMQEVEGTGETTGTVQSQVEGQGLLEGQSGYASGTTTGKTTASAPVLTTKGARIANGSHARKKAGSSGVNSKPKGGGGGGGKKEFKNDFDKYYNQVEDIAELERLRNLLESDYQQMLKSEAKSGKQIYDNLKKQIELLEEQRFLVDDLAEKRKQQIFDTMKDEQYKDVAKYAWWNEEDQTIEIDWQSIDKIKDSETGDLVKEYVGKLEGFQSKYDEQIEALEDIEDTLQEIAERGKEEYTSLEDRVRDALIQKIQDQIEDLTKVNEAINEANQKVLDSISETLELQRQERENAKTEESLADKEQRLAYLRQDSSNANAVEIARLEKELEEERENYTDTLIDQKISELQKQNEKAQEQRQQQIDLMQESLDYQEKTGAFWDQVYQYINQGIDALGQLVQGSALQDLLMGGEGITGLSQIGQMEWLKELEGQVAQAVGYLYLSRQLEKVGTKEGTTITFTNAEGQELTGVVDSKGNVTVTKEDGSKVVYKNVYQDYAGKYRTLESEADAVAPEEPATTTKPGGTERPPVYQGNGTGKDWSIKKVGSAWSVYSNVNHGEYATEAEARSAAYEKNKAESIWGVKLTQNRYSPNMLGGNYTFYEAQQAANSLNAGKPIVTPYATGGLNTHTGPAWLDGTKSHPELVLNARDTENFIQLKDTLATLKANGGLNLAGGDNYYDIVVNVDQMSSDYDVDRAIDRIKARLYQDGAYRNVNTLSRLR